MKEKAALFALIRLLGWASEHNTPRGNLLRGQMRLEQSRICVPGGSQEAKLAPAVPAVEAKQHPGSQPLLSALIAPPQDLLYPPLSIS